MNRFVRNLRRHTHRSAYVLALTTAIAFPAGAQSPADPAALVNPMIGTANSGFTFPGAVVPFGMVAFSPSELASSAQKRNTPGGYLYAGTTVRGFSLTHLSGAGCAGGGDFLFMPLTHGVAVSPALDVRSSDYTSGLSHTSEHAEAGFYRVTLENGVSVELTATTRTGAARFTYPTEGDAVLLIRSADNDLGSTDSQVKIDPSRRRVSGWLASGDFCWTGGPPESKPYYRIYFVAYFDHALRDYGTWQDASVRPHDISASGGTSMVAKHTSSYSEPGRGSGAYVSFANDDGPIGMRVGVSFVSEANAEANLKAEDPNDGSFDHVKADAHRAWRQKLSSISIEGGTRADQTTFYTALYHSLLFMNVASDVNGQYRGMDQAVHTIQSPQRAQYANFSGWDQYRSQLQLVTMLFPQVGSDMAQSLLNQADQLGCWSRWTHNSGATGVMNGDPSAAAIADIYAFGGREFDVRGAYESLLKAATVPMEERGCSRQGLAQWMSLHYLTGSTSGHDNSVANTLEYATADFALSQLAGSLNDPANAHELLNRAQYWKNLFNPQATPDEGYLQSRRSDGSWRSFDPASGEGFVEGSGAQYVWMVPFNEQALFELMGGDKTACRRLDGFFHNADGSWAFQERGLHPGMDNEPSIEVPWLYDYCGEPFKTQQVISAIRSTLWNDTPGGIPGNDDLGEMSSWYVWAALGMYPEIPGRAELLLASPLFPRAVIHRKGVDIVITTRRSSPSAQYIQGVRLNGHAWHDSWLPQGFLSKAEHLSFDLGDQPDRDWGVVDATPPPSFNR